MGWGCFVSVLHLCTCSLVLDPRRGDVRAKVKMRPMRLGCMDCRGVQSTRLQAKEFPSCHPSGQGAENKEVPGRGPPQEDSRLVSPVRARGGGNRCAGGCLDGRMPLGSSWGCCARAREREATRWTGGLKVREPTEGGRQEEVSMGSASTSYLPYLPSGVMVGRGTQGAGWKDKVWGSLFAGRQGQWLGSPFEKAQAGSSETC